MSAPDPDPAMVFDPVAAFLRRPLHEIVGTSAASSLSNSSSNTTIDEPNPHATTTTTITPLPSDSPPPPPPPPPTTSTSTSTSTTSTIATTTSSSISSLHKLAQEYAWVSILEVTASLLAESEGTSSSVLLPHERLLCSMYRTIALLQTGQLDRASTSIQHLGDLSNENMDYRYEKYQKEYSDDSTKKEGSFIPFELKLLAIDIRMRQGDYDAIYDAYELKNNIDNIEVDSDDKTNESTQEEQHEHRHQLTVILSAIASYHLKMGQSDAAVDIAAQLIQLCTTTTSTPTSNATVLSKHENEMISDAWYLKGTVLLHVGDFQGCEMAFKKASSFSNEDIENDAKIHFHSAMLSAARGKFNESIMEYDEAINICFKDFTRWKSLAVVVSNNVAISLIHVGRVVEAIERIERILRKDPKLALDEGLVYNLGTLYKVAHPDCSEEKLRTLHALSQRYAREGYQVDTEMFPFT